MKESGRSHTTIILINLPICLFPLYRLRLAWFRGKALVPLLLAPITYFIAVHWITFPLFRYMLPVMPHVISLAAFGFVESYRCHWAERNICSSNVATLTKA